MTVAEAADALTTGQIARQFGVPVHRVEYIILSRYIKPSGRLARWRLFDREAVERIGAALREKD